MRAIVIGAGASGLIAALKASEISDVTILERNDKAGKKLLLTGNGHCNYWNEDITIQKYEADSPDLIAKIITEQNKEDTLNFLYKLGIYPKVINGYYYPYSRQSYSFREVLMQNISKKKIPIIYNALVKNIIKENNEFIIFYNDEVIKADKVIVATGSKAYPKTGSDGSFYAILKFLGHSVNPIYPALTSLVSEGGYLKKWSGIRTDAKVSIFVNDKLIKEESGEVQLTDYGISGVCVFNLSSIAAQNIGSNKVTVALNFLPNIADAESWLNKRAGDLPHLNMKEILESLFSYKLTDIFLQKAGINQGAYYKSLTIKEKESLIKILTSFELNIMDTGSFDKAQVCKGGIPLKEINSFSMESKIISGLYLVGEILDVNGICGGYNLAFAFISAYIAGALNA